MLIILVSAVFSDESFPIQESFEFFDLFLGLFFEDIEPGYCDKSSESVSSLVIKFDILFRSGEQTDILT